MSGISSPVAGRHAARIAGQALGMLRSCVPELRSLAENPRLPDRHLITLLRWTDDLAAADPAAAVSLEVLKGVLPALNAALLASHAFAGIPPCDPSLRRLRLDLELADLGGALLVERTRACAGVLAVAFHGAAGAALVRRANEELREAMMAIAAMIARRR